MINYYKLLDAHRNRNATLEKIYNPRSQSVPKKQQELKAIPKYINHTTRIMCKQDRVIVNKLHYNHRLIQQSNTVTAAPKHRRQVRTKQCTSQNTQKYTQIEVKNSSESFMKELDKSGNEDVLEINESVLRSSQEFQRKIQHSIDSYLNDNRMGVLYQQRSKSIRPRNYNKFEIDFNFDDCEYQFDLA